MCTLKAPDYLALSFKQNDEVDSNSAFNVGIGIQSSTTTILGDGVVANEPLPPGTETVPLKTVDDIGLMLMISFTFFTP